MQFYCKANVSDDKVDQVCEALANLYGDEASPEAAKSLLAQSGVVLFTAQQAIAVDRLLRELGSELELETLTPTVAVPYTEGEQALPKSFRASTMITRLLGEEVGDIPTTAVYDLIDIITAVDVPEDELEAQTIADALARAVCGVTQAVPDKLKALSGLEAFRSAYLASCDARNKAAAEARDTTTAE
jgi:hypothetical protein